MFITKFPGPAKDNRQAPPVDCKAPVEQASHFATPDKALNLQIYHLVRISQLCAILAISRSTVYGRMSQRSNQFDPKFPRPMRLGPRSIGWRLSDVLDYINALRGE